MKARSSSSPAPGVARPAETALMLAAAGPRVAISDINEATLDETGRLISGRAANCWRSEPTLRWKARSGTWSVPRWKPSVATMYGQQGIRCNAIAPELILHNRLATVFPEEHIHIDAENILAPKPGTPEDIDNAVIFLASDAARVVNGHVMPVDGGLLAHTPTYAQTRAFGSGNLPMRKR